MVPVRLCSFSRLSCPCAGGRKVTGTERTVLGAAPARLPIANSSSQIPAQCWPEIGWIFLIICLLTIRPFLPYTSCGPLSSEPSSGPGARAPENLMLSHKDAGGDDDDDGDSSICVLLPVRRGKSMREGRVGSRPASSREALKVRAIHGASKGEQPCQHLSGK